MFGPKFFGGLFVVLLPLANNLINKAVHTQTSLKAAPPKSYGIWDRKGIENKVSSPQSTLISATWLF